MTNRITKKKPFYPVSKMLLKYLDAGNRTANLPFSYNDLLRFTSSISHTDKNGKETLWESVIYDPSEMAELNSKLVSTYAEMKFSGNKSLMEHLSVDRIDYCDFGNSKPFRIRIVNQFNDNHDYYYVKIADASRIYGLELEDILSPNRIHFIVDGNTLIEEHIAGIPGDTFVYSNSNVLPLNEVRIAKEFVKFNERCFVRLLGDMRAYNFVIVVTADFDNVQYRIRAIDFDQQSYEGSKNIYLPQFFKENRTYVDWCMQHLNPETIKQYQQEERSLMSKRYKKAKLKIQRLLEAMKDDELSTPEKINELKNDLKKHYNNSLFEACNTMGDIISVHLKINLLD